MPRLRVDPADAVSPQIRFFVSGRPRPQGSKTSRGGKVVDANSRSRPWRDEVSESAARAHAGPFLGPVQVDAVFRFGRPSTTSGARSRHPFTSGTPDIDKLLRAVLDALQVAGVIRNDCQVVRVIGEKAYADARAEGVAVTVTPFREAPE